MNSRRIEHDATQPASHNRLQGRRLPLLGTSDRESRLTLQSRRVALDMSLAAWLRSRSAPPHKLTEFHMRNLLSCSVFGALLMAAAALLPGCASRKTEPAAMLGRTIVVVPCDDLDLSARLIVLDGDLHVHGTFRVREGYTRQPGHVDVIVRSVDGEEWASAQAAVRHRPSGTLRGGASRSAYEVAFSRQPPAGSTVTVRHHREALGHQ